MSNVNDDLLARGLDPTRIGALKKFRDSGVAVGGPIKRDRLWFFAAAREGVAQQYADGVYWNKLTQPASLLYEPDIDRGIANTNDYSKDVSFRLTWQATEKHKFVVSSSFQNNCNCVFNLLTTGARVTPEAAGPHKYYPNYLPSAAWTYPATSNVLLEAGVSLQALDQNDTREEGWDDTSVPHPGPGAEPDLRQRRDANDSAPAVPAAVRDVVPDRLASVQDRREREARAPG